MSRPDLVNPLSEYQKLLNSFYGFIRSGVGNLGVNQFLQLRLTADILDLSEKEKWWSYGILNQYFDVPLKSSPTDDRELEVTPTSAGKLSREYYKFLINLAKLVKFRTPLTRNEDKEISDLYTEINNAEERNQILIDRLDDRWLRHARFFGLDDEDFDLKGDWLQGQPDWISIVESKRNNINKVIYIEKILKRQTEDVNDQIILDTLTAYSAASSNFIYPLKIDSDYNTKGEPPLINFQYLANLIRRDTTNAIGFYLMKIANSLTRLSTLTSTNPTPQLEVSQKLTDTVTTNLEQEYGEKVKIDFSTRWNRWFYFAGLNSLSEQSRGQIETDFNNITSVKYSVNWLIPVKIQRPWLDTSLFTHPIVLKNPQNFSDFFSVEKGLLRFIPDTMVMAKGIKISFTNDSTWKYDYDGEIVKKSTSKIRARFFGIPFGGSRRKTTTKLLNDDKSNAKVQGSTITFDDGQFVRNLGYIATKYAPFDGDSSVNFIGSDGVDESVFI